MKIAMEIIMISISGFMASAYATIEPGAEPTSPETEAFFEQQRQFAEGNITEMCSQYLLMSDPNKDPATMARCLTHLENVTK
jgi:hypothetical protein